MAFIWYFLSLFIGPAFFVLIETSIKKGFKSAVFLDVGILISDAVCIYWLHYLLLKK